MGWESEIVEQGELVGRRSLDLYGSDEERKDGSIIIFLPRGRRSQVIRTKADEGFRQGQMKINCIWVPQGVKSSAFVRAMPDRAPCSYPISSLQLHPFFAPNDSCFPTTSRTAFPSHRH